MTLLDKFDDIRPYNDNEVRSVIQRLKKDPMFMNIMTPIFSKMGIKDVDKLLDSIHTKDDFQEKIGYHVFRGIAKETTVSLDFSGLNHLSNKEKYTFISNHRDIILDAAWLNILLFDHQFKTTEIAIGDNLFVFDWIRDIARLNKSFVVKRNLAGRQMLEASLILSDYIHYTVTRENNSIWIAQREGRSKNSDDRTQESLLKMLAMGGNGIIQESLMELNIIPLTLSYEYDPCDFLKAKEFQLKRDNPEYKKTREDDFLNMKTGLNGQKGRVHFRAGYPINPFLETIDDNLPKAEKLARIASYIDTQIHYNYHIYPCNYIAYDHLYGVKNFSTYYSVKEEKIFMEYMTAQISKINIENKDTVFLKKKILEMYSNPLKNKLIANDKLGNVIEK